jgi:hypothetical protein
MIWKSTMHANEISDLAVYLDNVSYKSIDDNQTASHSSQKKSTIGLSWNEALLLLVITIVQGNNQLFGTLMRIRFPSQWNPNQTSWTTNPSTHFNKSSENFTEKYSIDPAKILNAAYHFLTYGPNFGDNADIMVVTNSNATNVFPISYTDTTGKDDNTFTGDHEFTTCDIEGFKLA